MSLIVAGSRPGGPALALFSTLERWLTNGQLEVLIATASQAPVAGAARAGVRVLRAASGTTVPRLRAAGLEAARAPIVALTEDFCVPSPGWADALLDAHARVDAVAIGGPIDCTGGRATDWALTLVEYGRFFGSSSAGAVGHLPGTNVSYKAEALRAILGGLPTELVETTVHATLRDRGATLWRDPRAVMVDVND